MHGLSLITNTRYSNIHRFGIYYLYGTSIYPYSLILARSVGYFVPCQPIFSSLHWVYLLKTAHNYLFISFRRYIFKAFVVIHRCPVGPCLVTKLRKWQKNACLNWSLHVLTLSMGAPTRWESSEFRYKVFSEQIVQFNSMNNIISFIFY